MTLESARAARDAGMEQVGQKAERVSEGFALSAGQHLQLYAYFNHEFPAHKVVASYANLPHLPQPHDLRAWGPVFMKAIKRGLIERVGYTAHPGRHASACPVYKSRIAL